MEDVVKSAEGLWEFQAEHVGGDLILNFEWSEALLVEFLGRAFGFNILGVKPDQRTNFEVRCGYPVARDSFGVLLMSDADLFL